MARTPVDLGNGAKFYHRQCTTAGVPIGGYVAVPSAKKIDPPNASREKVETTDLDSEGDVKEYAPGDSDPGESSLEIHFQSKNAVHREIRDAAQVGTTLYQFKIVYGNGDYEEWKGFYQGMSRSVERNVPIVGQITIGNSGLATLTSI